MLKTAIPFIDLRGRTPIDLLRAYPDKARELMRAASGTWGIVSRLATFLALPYADRASRAWLTRTGNPYLHEIESMAEIQRMRGLFALNLSYEWGCTGGAYRTNDTVTMLRVLDWPFPEIGRHVVIALQDGKAGSFYNVTWPGLAGVFTGMAPARFSCAINQAPMRRHGRSFIGDWYENRKLVKKQFGLPPSHLLRQVFETAADYASAKTMLMHTPLAMPAIFILAGTKAGEGIIIERLENSFAVRELSGNLEVSTANDFESGFAGTAQDWRPRPIDSAGRYRQSCSIVGHELAVDDFAWLHPPIMNSNTRLCIIADAAISRLCVQGYEGVIPSTLPFILPRANQTRRKQASA